ncbi:uncharacterized protein LOC111375522 isoform X2 [Olea europaea var. sylvestris]|uniref:uncharacterized protein LOC111375522 isoform X1 n=1 Tax=Olea europaea var. sylvestris TaxID=158386 RepID=UPI000C1D2167|nr:uncharacterized protein LOC111375522 isoform X1 [Olea europaea var. sylvestris]XP_022854128.1 uncharacterized protein LOC111375522 isoform X2 [Olea europaea var. sylvestris]
MEDQCSPLSWAYYYQEEGIEDLKHSFLYSTLELETGILSAHEELSRKDDEILHLKNLLTKIVRERDEFEGKCQTLMMEKQLIFQQVEIQKKPPKQNIESAPSSGTNSNEDENNIGLPSDCDENNFVPSPLPETFSDVPSQEKIVPNKPLPEKGKFLQAVMEAGPLLKTLMLAGPLPQWQHPPPQINSIDIPPVAISSPRNSNGLFSNKRALMNGELGQDFSPKFQKVVHQNHH